MLYLNSYLFVNLPFRANELPEKRVILPDQKSYVPTNSNNLEKSCQ